MKILIIPSWYPNEKDPLWGNYFIKQAEALNEKCEVFMLHINRVGLKEFTKIFSERNKDGYYTDKHKFKFYRKTILNYKSINLDFSYKKYAKNAYKAYKNFEAVVGRPDIILVESALPAGLAAKYISEKEGIPYIVHEHSEGIMTNIIYKDYCDSIIKNSVCYMAVNKNIKKIVESKGKECYLVPNFIDCSKFKISDNKNKEFTLISVSNFYKVKAIDILLKAFSKVVYDKKIDNIKLKIVGTGEYKDYYESIAKSLKLDNYVEFLGYVENDKLPDILSKANALCVSSTFETFCIPIVEAFASGIPVITTDCVGPLEIVNEKNSIVTPINDIDKYADSIEKMIKEYDKFNGKKIREYALKNYDKNVVTNKIIEICEKHKNC